MAGIAEPRFRFLDLPKEIRLMIYERLPITITESRVHVTPSRKVWTYTPHRSPFLSQSDRTHNTYHWTRETAAILTSSAPSLAILTTCRMVHDEARHIIFREIRRIPLEDLRPHARVDCMRRDVILWLEKIAGLEFSRDLKEFEVIDFWKTLYEPDGPQPSEEDVRNIMLFLKRIIVFRERAKKVGLRGKPFDCETVNLEMGGTKG